MHDQRLRRGPLLITTLFLCAGLLATGAGVTAGSRTTVPALLWVGLGLWGMGALMLARYGYWHVMLRSLLLVPLQVSLMVDDVTLGFARQEPLGASVWYVILVGVKNCGPTVLYLAVPIAVSAWLTGLPHSVDYVLTAPTWLLVANLVSASSRPFGAYGDPVLATWLGILLFTGLVFAVTTLPLLLVAGGLGAWARTLWSHRGLEPNRP
jgi:hypothetical protein